ncbi:MAG: hypothetical protein K9G71_17465 [Rhodobacteraceae bacterium]|nr:hypothetical protein [Paracoccaceae bacterium]
MSIPDVNPVSTYEQSLWWMIQNLPEPEVEAVINGLDPMPPIFRLVSDTYWVTPRNLRVHLKKLWGELR